MGWKRPKEYPHASSSPTSSWQLASFCVLHRQGNQFHEGNRITCAQSTSARPSTAQLLHPTCVSFCRAFVEPQAREQRLPLLRGSGRLPWQPSSSSRSSLKEEVQRASTQRVIAPSATRSGPRLVTVGLSAWECLVTRACRLECHPSPQTRHDAFDTMHLSVCRPGLPRNHRA